MELSAINVSAKLQKSPTVVRRTGRCCRNGSRDRGSGRGIAARYKLKTTTHHSRSQDAPLHPPPCAVVKKVCSARCPEHGRAAWSCLGGVKLRRLSRGLVEIRRRERCLVRVG